jgi:hypothetical protein
MPKLSEIIVNLQERPPIAIAASLETLDGCRMRDEWIVPDGVIVFVLSNPSRFGLEKGSFIQADSIQAFGDHQQATHRRQRDQFQSEHRRCFLRV